MGKSGEKIKFDIHDAYNPSSARSRLSTQEKRYNDALQDPKATGWLAADIRNEEPRG